MTPVSPPHPHCDATWRPPSTKDLSSCGRREVAGPKRPGWLHRAKEKRDGLRKGGRGAPPLVRQPAVQGHQAGPLGTRGGRAARHHPPGLRGRSRRRRGLLRSAAAALRAGEVHHHLRPLLAWPGGGDEEDGHRGDLPGRLGDLRQGVRARGPGPRPRELPSQPGTRRGGADRPRPAHRRQEPAPRPRADERGAAQVDARGGLPAIHHRRRRHRPRRRRARAQPHPALRRGGGAGLPHRGPEARREEVRPPGRQGARLGGRAAEAPLRGALPARHHGRAGDRRRPDRRRVGHAARRAQRRPRSAVHPRRHQRLVAHVQGGLPRHPAPVPAGGRGGAVRARALRAVRGGVRRRRRLAGEGRLRPGDRRCGRRPREGRERGRRARQGLRRIRRHLAARGGHLHLRARRWATRSASARTRATTSR